MNQEVRSKLASRFQQPCRIAGQQIDFEIDLVADADLAQRGDAQGVRDHQHRKSIAVDLVDGERHAVERDRTFEGDEAREGETDALRADGPTNRKAHSGNP